MLYQLSYSRLFRSSPGWWRGEDSNLRRQSRQIYSLLPLATRVPLRFGTTLVSTVEHTQRVRPGRPAVPITVAQPRGPSPTPARSYSLELAKGIEPPTG